MVKFENFERKHFAYNLIFISFSSFYAFAIFLIMLAHHLNLIISDKAEYYEGVKFPSQ